MFKIFQKCHFSWAAIKCSRSAHNNVIDFEKYFQKCFTTFKFLKIKPFENFPLYSILCESLFSVHFVSYVYNNPQLSL